MTPAIITLTTDFGLADSYVAQMKGVILSINPAARLVDITHQIPAQDILRAAFLLNDLIDTFPQGTIHLAVVDPGVGSRRRLMAVEMARQKFVLPDNGLVSVIERRAAVDCAVELTERRFWRQLPMASTSGGGQAEPSNTFHGRDVMAPVAAHLSLGHELSQFGRPLGPDLQQLPLPEPRRTDDAIQGEVMWIDSFGNLITNIHESLLCQAKLPDLQVAIGQFCISGIDQYFSQRAAGELLALIGSSGLLEIAVNQGSAARQLGVSADIPVEVRLRSAT